MIRGVYLWAQMGSRRLHVVAFDVPYPPDYGGAMDIWYRLEALHALGIKVVLHVWQYRRPPAPELHDVCAEVHYYTRPLWRDLLSVTRPYIVASRRDPALLERLLSDRDPVLFEGLHTTAFLAHPALSGRMTVVRMHNVEHDYYRQLASRTTHPVIRTFFRVEAVRLQRYENTLRYARWIAAISQEEQRQLAARYGLERVFLLPPAHPYREVSLSGGTGEYALYHGHLAVPENREAALFLMREVFSRLKIPLVVAGRHPGQTLRKTAARMPHVRLVANPDSPEMDRLIRGAQVVLLPGWQSAGQRLKLIASLYQARHILASPAMVRGSGWEDLCLSASTPDEWVEGISNCWDLPVSEAKTARRTERLREWDTGHHTLELVRRMGLGNGV